MTISEEKVISTRHITELTPEMRDNSIIVVYADTDSIFLLDARDAQTIPAKNKLVENLIKDLTSGANFDRQILSRNQNIYFVY